MESRSPSGRCGDLSLAIEALEKGQVDEAIHLLHFATTMNPNSAEAHFHLGRAYQARDNGVLAEASYRRAVTLAPQHAPALCALGVLLARQQNPLEARRVLEAALQADPRCREAEEALRLLPHPEDHAALAQLLQLASHPAPLASDVPQRSHRLLVATALFSLSLVFVLGLAFWQIQQFASIQAPRDGEPAGSTWGSAPVSSPAAETSGEAESAPTSEASDSPAASETPAASPEPPPSVVAYLERLYGAQDAHHADRGRYASLSELAAAGRISAAAASGKAVEECDGAVLSEEAPGPSTFSIRAVLPDGRVVVVDQSGGITTQ